MIDPRGILVAGAIAIAATGAHAAYRAWPAAYGTEVHVPAALVRLPGDLGLVSVQLPLTRLALDVPHKQPPSGESFEAVRRIGRWWIDDAPAGVNARRLRGHTVYLQLLPGSPLWPGGPVQMRGSTISNAPAEGAINLAGIVTGVNDDGYVWVDFSFGPIAVPSAVAAAARPVTPGGGPRHATGPPTQPATDAGVAALLRVLPSGRAALTGVIVNGTRH